MKKASDVFKSIRFAKSEPRGKAHKSTDDEGHYTVGEKEFNQQLQHVKKMAMMEESEQIDEGLAKAEKYKSDGDMLNYHKHMEKHYGSLASKEFFKNKMKENDIFRKHNNTAMKHYDSYLNLKKQKAEQVKEAVKDKFDIGEYDQEGDMAKSDLRSILANAKRVHDMLEDSDNLPEWVQSKITKAEDYMSTVANYMEAEMNEEVKAVTVKHKTSGKELVVTPEKAKQLKPQGYHPVKEDVVQEGRPSQRHPLEGHDYHKKTNAELEYIAKDAHKAAEAMKSHNTTAENKYRDQANDSATVRHFRKTSGSPDWYKKKYGLKEDVEQIDEKNVPTSPEKWAQAKAQAKAKFDVYPSAYANGWAAKKYKEMGGGWKSVSEAKEEKPPFDPDPPRKQQVVAGKYGVGYSTARHLARMAMQKQSEKMKKPIKEEEMSNKAKIVKTIAKKKKDSADSFQKDPIISKSEVKM